MILGMTTAAFTLFHVIISLIGIASGFVVIFGLITARRLPLVTQLFLFTTVLTSVTGFFFPNKTITPGMILGVLSLVALLAAIVALYAGRLKGSWRTTYVITVVLAQYFNVFVLVAQLFAKLPALQAMGAQASLEFKIAQFVVLVGFIFLGRLSLKGFRSA